MSCHVQPATAGRQQTFSHLSGTLVLWFGPSLLVLLLRSPGAGDAGGHYVPALLAASVRSTPGAHPLSPKAADHRRDRKLQSAPGAQSAGPEALGWVSDAIGRLDFLPKELLVATLVVAAWVACAVRFVLPNLRRTEPWPEPRQEDTTLLPPSSGPAAGNPMQDVAAVFILGTASGVSGTFVFGFLSQMIGTFPDVPAFLADPLTGSLVLVFCFGLGQLLGTPVWGWLSDCMASRPLFNLCLGWSMAALLTFGLCQTFATACLARFFGGLMDGTNLVMISFTAHAMRRLEGTKAQVYLTIAQFCGVGLGFLVGTWIGGLANPVAQFGWATPFLAMHPYLFPCLVAAGLNALGVAVVMQGDVGLRPPPIDTEARQGFLPSLRKVWNGQVIVCLTILVGLYFGMASYALMAIQWITAPLASHGMGFSPLQKVAYLIAAVTLYLPATLVLGDRIVSGMGYRDACVACAWFAAAGYAVHGLSSYVIGWNVVAGWAVLLLSEALRRFFITQSAVCAIQVGLEAVPKALTGTCNGVLMAGICIGASLGPFASGPLYHLAETSTRPFPFNYYFCFLVVVLAQVVTAYFAAKLDVDPERLARREAHEPSGGG
eukprot:EG_transcript_5331